MIYAGRRRHGRVHHHLVWRCTFIGMTSTCLILTQDASIIIGEGGAHVNKIHGKSGARVVVLESIPGNPERILNVSGLLDAVSKVRTRWCGRVAVVY